LVEFDINIIWVNYFQNIPTKQGGIGRAVAVASDTLGRKGRVKKESDGNYK
jgi:hypothetical protein